MVSGLIKVGLCSFCSNETSIYTDVLTNFVSFHSTWVNLTFVIRCIVSCVGNCISITLFYVENTRKQFKNLKFCFIKC